MFLPIGDTPNPRGYMPWVNWGLMAANVAIFLFLTVPLTAKGVDPRDPALTEYIRVLAPHLHSRAELVHLLQHASAYDLFVFEHGYKPAAPQVGDLFFSMFLHGGWLHLAGNMLFLWIFGNNVEHRMGHAPYLLAYLGTGAIATLAFAVLAGQSMVPLVGASGAISGVLGIYFLAFPRNKVKVFVFLFPIWLDVILIPCRWVLGFFVVIDNLLPIFLGAQSGVAHGAHLGGFAAGLAVAGVGRALAWRLPWGRTAWKASADPYAALESDPVAAIQGAVENGDRELAINALRHIDLGSLRRLTPFEGTQVAEWLFQIGELGPAERVLRQVMGNRDLSDREIARALLIVGLIRLADGQFASGYQYLNRVVERDADAEASRRARAALERVPLSRRFIG